MLSFFIHSIVLIKSKHNFRYKYTSQIETLEFNCQKLSITKLITVIKKTLGSNPL